MPAVPNQVQPPTSNGVIYEEINAMIANYKAVENQMSLAMDTPIKMIKIFRLVKSVMLNTASRLSLRRSVQ